MNDLTVPSVVSWQYVGMGIDRENPGAYPYCVDMSQCFRTISRHCAALAKRWDGWEFYIQEWLIEDYVATAPAGEMMRVQ